MIGNITKGADFGGICTYLLHPDKEAQIIGGNVAGTTPGELEAEFMAFASLNQRVKKVVNHISLGFAPEDGVVTREMQERIGEQIMRELGYGNAQYLIVAHGREDPGHDTPHDHDHLHIVANAVDLDGKWVNDFQSFRRLEKVLRGIEREEGLKEIQSSWEVKKRAPSHGQTQRYKREVREVAAGNREAATLPVSDRLQTAIDLAATDSQTVVEFARTLAQAGISTKFKVTRTGKVQGISYGMEGVSYQGNQLYDASLPKLQSARGLTFNAGSDLKVIADINLNPHPPAVEIEPLPLKPDPIVTDLTPHQIEQMSEQELLAHIHYQRSLQMEVAQKQQAEHRKQLTEEIKQQEAERKRQSAENFEGFKERIQASLKRAADNSSKSVRKDRVSSQPPIVAPPTVTLPIPEDPRDFNQRLRKKADESRNAAHQRAKQAIAKLAAMPKRSLLNWRGMTSEQFENGRVQILTDLKAEIKTIEQIVKDKSKPLPVKTPARPEPSRDVIAQVERQQRLDREAAERKAAQWMAPQEASSQSTPRKQRGMGGR
jgi:Relaxase/Mobilisation nuclease domain